MDPPLDAIPDGEWFCPDCEEDPSAPIVIGSGKRKPVKGGKAKAKTTQKRAKEEEIDEDEEDEEETGRAGQKRKGAGKSGRKSPEFYDVWYFGNATMLIYYCFSFSLVTSCQT